MKDLPDNNEQNSKLDPLLQMALDMFKTTYIYSRDYADTVSTEEGRNAQLDRSQEALDRANYRDSQAYWNSSDKPLR